MNTQKKGTFQFCFPGLLGIHRNPKWKEFLRSRKSFLKKVSICTLTDLNPGLGGPWNKLQIILVNGTFIMPQVFWPKFFLNFMHGFKFAILAIFTFCQNGTFEPVHEIQKFFWPKDFFWGIMKVPCTKSNHNFFQGPPNPGFRSVKVQNETFLKKDSQDFKNSFYLWFLWIPSKPGKPNWKLPFFRVFIIVKKTSVI